jgi:hypothetical protein
MYKTVVIDDMFGISTLLTEQRYRKDLDRYRSIHMYRGMPNADYRIVTSLQRICKGKRAILEPSILANFTKYAALEDPTIESSVWRQMILGQHHGMPTRLLDWSFSPLVGLHFATIEGGHWLVFNLAVERFEHVLSYIRRVGKYEVVSVKIFAV